MASHKPSRVLDISCSTNGISIHLFQVMDPGEYIYSGPAELAGDPYTVMDSDDHLVWVFPIRPHQPDQVKKPEGLVFSDMEDFENRGGTVHP